MIADLVRNFLNDRSPEDLEGSSAPSIGGVLNWRPGRSLGVEPSVSIGDEFSNSDLSRIEQDAKNAGYDSVAEHVMLETGLDMRNAADRKVLAEEYGDGSAEWKSNSDIGYVEAFDHYDLANSNEPRPENAPEISAEDRPSRDSLIRGCSRYGNSAYDNEFASGVYESTGLDVTDSNDAERFSRHLDGMVGDSKGGESIHFARRSILRIKENGAVVDYDREPVRSLEGESLPKLFHDDGRTIAPGADSDKPSKSPLLDPIGTFDVEKGSLDDTLRKVAMSAQSLADNAANSFSVDMPPEPKPSGLESNGIEIA